MGEAQKANCGRDKKGKKLRVSMVTAANRTAVVHIKDFAAGVSVCAKAAGSESLIMR